MEPITGTCYLEMVALRHRPLEGIHQIAWSREDNKKYRGKIDRVFVSMTETWETEHFIDQYLKTRGRDVNNENRDIVSAKLETAPGRAPHLRDDLNAWLDKEYGLAPV